jgi:hypothetical protein
MENGRMNRFGWTANDGVKVTLPLGFTMPPKSRDIRLFCRVRSWASSMIGRAGSIILAVAEEILALQAFVELWEEARSLRLPLEAICCARPEVLTLPV